MDTKKLRQKILDLAIRGKLVPQDPNDEPASVLLECIRAEKEQLIKAGKIKRSKKTASDTPHYENVPGGWISCTLEDLSLFIRNGVTLKQTKIINGFPITRIESISNGVLDFDKMGYADLTDEDLYKSYFLRPNDILFSHINSPIYVGKVALCDNVGERKIVHGMNLLCIRISEVVNSRYILYAIRSSVFKDKMRHYVQNAVNQASISINSVKIIPLPLPPINEQNRIVEEIEKWYDLIDVLENNKQDLQKYIKSARSEILKLAITGKLVPQNNTDEPAYELLKRINPSINSCDTSHYENLPAQWQVVPMSFLCTLADGEKQNGIESVYLDVKYLRGKGERVVMSSGKYVPENSTMILVDGENSGEIFTTQIAGYQGSTFKLLNISNEMYKPYILFVIRSYQTQFRENKVGSAIPHLNKKLFREIEVFVPPFEEQKRIVNKIDEIFNEIDLISGAL